MPALKLKDKDGNWITLPTAKGADGKEGVDGKSAYQQAVEAGYTGTEAAFYAALVSLKDGPFLPTSGGQMTGDIYVPALTITSPSGGYVYFQSEQREDTSHGLVLIDPDGMGVSVNGVSDPTLPADAANKRYVDSQITGHVQSVAKGGTGATTAASARSALGAAPLASPTFTGTPKAPATSTSYTTYQLRNIALVTSAPTSLSNGAVALVYS